MSLKGQITTAEPLMFADFKRLLSELHRAKDYQWELYMRVSFCTACRVSDVRKLKWQDVLNGNECIVKEQKTGKVRRIPINEQNHKAILALYRLLRKPPMTDYMFISSKTNEPFTTQYINRRLKNYRDKYHLKIQNFSTHSLRKTFGRYVYDSMGHSTEALILLNQILKHASINTTKVYIGITQGEIDSVFGNIHI